MIHTHLIHISVSTQASIIALEAPTALHCQGQHDIALSHALCPFLPCSLRELLATHGCLIYHLPQVSPPTTPLAPSLTPCVPAMLALFHFFL